MLQLIGSNNSRDARLTSFLFSIGFIAVFLINLIFQLVISNQLTDKIYHLFRKKLRTFSILLSIPFIIIFIHNIRESNFDGLKHELIIFAYFILIYIIIQIITQFIFNSEEKLIIKKNYKILLNKKSNKWLIILITSAGMITSAIALYINNSKELHNDIWRSAYYDNSLASSERYIKKYPDGKHIKEAKWLLTKHINTVEGYTNYCIENPYSKYLEEALWEKTILTNNTTAIDEYIYRYPNGIHVGKARILLNLDHGSYIDKRDNQSYRWVKIQNKIWMAENLNYYSVNSSYYNNDSINNYKYGRLYTWKDACRVCPEGWRLSSNIDWQELNDALGYNFTNLLKSSDGWLYNTHMKNSWNGSDIFGFSALPSGYGKYYDDNLKYRETKRSSYWWNSYKNADSLHASYWFINDDRCIRKEDHIVELENLYSVRCIKENN